MRPPVLVVGVGNALHPGDRTGVLVADRVARTTPGGVEVTTVGDPARLVDLGADREAMVVVDAAVRPPGAAGDVLVLTPQQLPATSAGRSLGTHGLGVVDALALGSTLGRLPARTLVVAVLVDRGGPTSAAAAADAASTPADETVAHETVAHETVAAAASVVTRLVGDLLGDLVAGTDPVATPATPRG
jgi:hydrogenase maturation protease